MTTLAYFSFEGKNIDLDNASLFKTWTSALPKEAANLLIKICGHLYDKGNAAASHYDIAANNCSELESICPEEFNNFNSMSGEKNYRYHIEATGVVRAWEIKKVKNSHEAKLFFDGPIFDFITTYHPYLKILKEK